MSNMQPHQQPTDSEVHASPERSMQHQGGELPVSRTEAGMARSIEKGATGNPAPVPPPLMPPAASAPPPTPQRPPAIPAPAPNRHPVMHGNPSIADDNDLIEKEWVIRAKQIVEHTRTDPHKQSEAMNLMKADYLKKRYNRTIKVTRD